LSTCLTRHTHANLNLNLKFEFKLDVWMRSVDLEQVFNLIDTGDGLISPEEFRVFLAVKKDMRKRARSGKLAEPEAARMPALGDRKLEEGARGKTSTYIAEFVCVQKTDMRDSFESKSKLTGYLTQGETVVVVAANEHRLRILRLKWCGKRFRLFLSAFPMFVPSLSWQNDRFYIQMAQKSRFLQGCAASDGLGVGADG
jgi:hypothetical protein